MSLSKTEIAFLEKLPKECIHAKNLVSKKNSKDIEDFYKQYVEFYKCMEIDTNIDKKIEAFIKYKEFAKQRNRNNKGKPLFTAQSKLEPTILEEFLCHLFKKYTDSNISAGTVKAYSNLYFSPTTFIDFKTNNFIKINHKDQDFAIYKIIKLNDGEKSVQISVPIVSIECKTYLDKTMLEGSVATADKIKSGNPHCKFYIVTETYEVDIKVDPSTSRIDNIFVLKKGGRNKRDYRVDSEVIKKLYKEIERHIDSKWSNIDSNISKYGCVFK